MKNIFLLTLAIIWIAGTSVAQSRLYVNPLANGQNNGSTWTNAFADLHHALVTAQTGDEVWVAEGEYRPDTASNRDRSFVLKSGVKLYGGFNGTEASLAQRDITAHPTVLSGNIGNPADSTDNSYTILYMAYPDTSTRLDGLDFRHGYAVSDTHFFNLSPVLSGGAVYVLAQNGKALPVFVNCMFRDNVAKSRGGAIFVHGQNSTGSTPIFRNCLFYNNKAQYAGGALYISGGNNLDRGIEFDHCRFESNTAGSFGGAISMENAFGSETLNFLSCKVTHSHTNIFGGFMYMIKSGINPSKITIDSCEISKNTCNAGPSGLYVTSNGVNFQTVFKLRNSKVFDNSESPFSNGGVISLGEYAHFSSSIIDTFIVFGNIVYDNKTSFSVIGLNSNNAWAKVEKNLVYNNGRIQSNAGGGIFVSGRQIEISENICYENTSLPLFGGIRAFSDSKLQIHDNILYGNTFLGQAGTYYSTSILGTGVSTIFGYTDSAQVFNNTFCKNTTWVTGQINNSPVPRKVYTNNVFLDNRDFLTGDITIPVSLGQDSSYFSHNLMDVDCGTIPKRVACGPNNLFNLDPLFRDTANHDYSLLPCSPLINAGSNASAAGILIDIAGNPRILEGTVDIGAYEAPAFALAAAPQVQPACIGASNGSISILPEHGCEPLVYAWSPNAGNGPELNGLPPGNFIFTITDGSGRQIMDTVVVASAPQPSLALTSTDVQCGTTSGGSLSASVTSGTAPFQYTWLPNASDTSNLSHLSPGSYALMVVDANGCQDSASASIALLGMLTLMVDGKTISCYNAADGWLSASPVTGAAPFSWGWQGWLGTDSIAQPLGPGMYAVTVSDAFGCTAAFSFPPMDQPDSLWATVGTNDQTDLIMPNGTAVVTTISGGTSPFDYLWEPGGSTTQAIAGLTAGSYTVTVTDNNGCQVVVQAVVDLMVGTEEAEGQAFVVYPNPAVDWVKVLLPKSMEKCSVELSDMTGKVLRSSILAAASAPCTIDLIGLPSGNYVMTVRNGTGKEMFVGKVTKMK
ncbi:MAG: T9SS type A sorting domain-containing protein [Saprospiraceae bacterium]